MYLIELLISILKMWANSQSGLYFHETIFARWETALRRSWTWTPDLSHDLIKVIWLARVIALHQHRQNAETPLRFHGPQPEFSLRESKYSTIIMIEYTISFILGLIDFTCLFTSLYIKYFYLRYTWRQAQHFWSIGFFYNNASDLQPFHSMY